LVASQCIQLKQFLLFHLNFATLSTSDDKKETVEFKLYFREQKQKNILRLQSAAVNEQI
jgi:hypothetical protein